MLDNNQYDAAQVLLRTKLYRPAISRDLIARPRLYARLDLGLERPFTMISAPAGYGKTTLVSSWLQSQPLPSLWISLDENDNDLRLFLGYLLKAIQSHHPAALRRTELMLSGPNLPAPEIIGDSLISELNAIEDEFILVLDDLHLLRDQQIYTLVGWLLRFPPRCLHLVLITRKDPPLALGKLRASGLMVELRGQELRFSKDETAAFISRVLGEPISMKTLDFLEQRTEGWAAGLRLTALTIRFNVEVTSGDDELHVLNRYVIDYLMDEVLERVPPEIEAFLIKTSVLDAMCGPLCDAVVQPAGGAGQGQTYLESLETSNLFTVALDEKGQWFRYHHLFREFLIHRMQRKLSADEIDTLHTRAADWLAGQQLVGEAIQHALAGRHIQQAVQLIAEHRHHLLNTEQRPVLERWLQMLPPGSVNDYPELLLTEAWIAELGRSDSRAVVELLNRAQVLIDKRLARDAATLIQLQAELDTLRCLEMSFAAKNPEEAIALASRALAVMPKNWHLVRAEAWLYLALAWQMTGDLAQAYETFAMARSEVVASDGPRARITGSAAFVQWMAGDLTGVLQTAQESLLASDTRDLHETLGWLNYFAASARYQRNELDLAERHAREALELRYACHPISVVQCTTILALVHQARGRPEEAQAVVERTFDFLRETRTSALLPVLQAFSVELAAMRGDFDSAAHWIATVSPLIPLQIMAFFYAPQLTAARVLVHTGNPSDLPLAAETIQRIENFVTATHNTWFTIEVLALRALERAGAGNMPAALQTLEQALTLAEPRGFIRVFADLGAPMAQLLEQLARQGVASGYIRRALLPAMDDGPSRGAVPIMATHEQSSLVEPLTAREMEVLELLAERRSAKEIAARLFISDRTVKRHSANIYQKLNVHSRNEALQMALTLGILPAR